MLLTISQLQTRQFAIVIEIVHSYTTSRIRYLIRLLIKARIVITEK